MNSNDKPAENLNDPNQAHPAPVAPNPDREENVLPAAAQTASNTVQLTPAPSSSSEQTASPAPIPAPSTEQQPLPAPVPVLKKRKPIQDPTFGGVLGKLETLSPSEQAELFACEQVIESGWATFVQVGLALATIKKNKPYRIDFGCFEDYCRAKWQFGRRQAYYLVSAAQLFKHLCTNCAQIKPEREWQLRPLIGLTLQQAQEAWEHAAKISVGRKITARTVVRAMHQLQIAPPAAPRPMQSRQNKSELCRALNATFGDLMALLQQKAAHENLIQKVEALHQQIQPFLPRLRIKA